jgi:hypothetical protein
VWQQVVAVGRRRSAMREAVVPNDLETASFIYNLFTYRSRSKTKITGKTHTFTSRPLKINRKT